MRKSPDQSLYDALFKASIDLGYHTYTHSPEAGTSYPFVRIGDVQLVPIPTKSFLLGHLYASADVWGDGKSRKTVSDMAHALMKAFAALDVLADGYKVKVSWAYLRFWCRKNHDQSCTEKSFGDSGFYSGRNNH